MMVFTTLEIVLIVIGIFFFPRYILALFLFKLDYIFMGFLAVIWGTIVGINFWFK